MQEADTEGLYGVRCTASICPRERSQAAIMLTAECDVFVGFKSENETRI